MKSYETVDEYVLSAGKFNDGLMQLREILASTALEETVKWGAPCYTYEGKNVVGMAAFKAYFGLWFHQGASIDDTAGVLINAQEGVTKALRQWRMTSSKDIKVRTIRSYVKQAIDVVRTGKEAKPDRNKPLVLPDELTTVLAKDKNVRTLFEGFNKGKQREFADYIRAAKRPETTLRRIDKILPMIKTGVGLNDRYRR